MNPTAKIIEDITRNLIVDADRNLLKATYGTAKGAHHPGTEPVFTMEHLNEAMAKLPPPVKSPVGFVCHSSYLQRIRAQSKQPDTAAAPDPAGNTLSALYGIQFYPDDQQEHACLAFYDIRDLKLWLDRRKLWGVILQSAFDGAQVSGIPAPPIGEKEARDLAAERKWPYSAEHIMLLINHR